MEIFLKLAVYVCFLLLFCLPGLPLGLWLCGKDVKRHPEALIYGLLLGHFLSSGLAVGLIYLIGFSALSLGLFIALTAGWLVVGFRYLRREGGRAKSLATPSSETPPGPYVQTSAGQLPFKAWDRYTYALFLGLLLVAAALIFEPFSNLGKKTPSGYAYRKYFSGDFLKEVAVTAELSRGEIPPQNPWFAGETLHYYWWYFIPPALFHRLMGMDLSLQALLVLSTFFTDVLFLFMLFSTLRLFAAGPLAPFLAALIGVAGYSYEVMYLWWKLQGSFHSFLEQARAYNVDATTRWFWGEPQMDGFFRALLYTPQHLQALALLLGVISIFILRQVLGSFSLSWVTGLMVGVSIGYSMFIGLTLALWYGLCLGIQLLGLTMRQFIAVPSFLGGTALNRLNTVNADARLNPLRCFLSLLLSGGLIGFLVLLSYSLGMFSSDPDTGLQIYVGKALKTYGPLVFLMNYGPPILFGIWGILLIGRKGTLEERENGRGELHAPLLYPLLLLLLAVALISTVAIPGFLSDVGLKLGLIFLATLLIFSTVSLEFLYRRWPKPAFYLLLAFITAPALLSALIDRSHLADISNAKFTLYISEEDMQAATWIKTHVPDRAIVQSSSPEFKVSFFTLIPVLGERRTAVGDKFYARIFQIPPAAVERRKGDIAQLFETSSLAEAMEILKKYQINYLYLGEWEKASYPQGVQKFYSFPNLFEKVYGNPKVDLFKILSYEPELIALEGKVPVVIHVGESQTVPVTLKNQDRRNSHVISVQAAALSQTETPADAASIDTEAPAAVGTPVQVQLAEGEEKWISVPLPTLPHPGTYTLVLQAAQVKNEENARQRFSVEAEAVKGSLGKIREDPEASEGKAVFIGSEITYSRPWSFLLNRKFSPGDYLLGLRVKTQDNRLSDKIFTWEVAASRGGDKEQLEIAGTDFQEALAYQNLDLAIHLAEEDTLRFSIWYHSKADIWVDQILITLSVLARKVYPSGIQVEG